MYMVRPRDISHLDHVDAETTGGLSRFYHPSVADAATFPLTDPTFSIALLASGQDRMAKCTFNGELLFQLLFERAIQLAVTYVLQHRPHQRLKFNPRHGRHYSATIRRRSA